MDDQLLAIREVIRQEEAAVAYFDALLLSGAPVSHMARYGGLRTYHLGQIEKWRGRL